MTDISTFSFVMLHLFGPTIYLAIENNLSQSVEDVGIAQVLNTKSLSFGKVLLLSQYL